MSKYLLRAVALLLATSLIFVSVHAQGKKTTKGKKATPLPKGITLAMVKAHVMAPAHTKGKRTQDLFAFQKLNYKLPIPVKAPATKGAEKGAKTPPHLDVGLLCNIVHTALKDNVTGYILQLRKDGNLAAALYWNWARTPIDGNKGWTADTRMHIASCSKFLTAVGMVKALDAKGISYDAKISTYLPIYWKRGANISKITFRHLMTHTSGFTSPNGETDYAFMKGKVAAGVTASAIGKTAYQNMNFGLCRILISIVTGAIAKDAEFHPNTWLNDHAWDLCTVSYFKTHMQKKVFTPAGVANVGFAPPSGGKGALAYSYPDGGVKGWDSGDLKSAAGPAGFRLSVKELLEVMNHVRRKGTILPVAKAQTLLDSSFGIDWIIPTPAGKMYTKNGGWTPDGAIWEQCVLYFLPNGMELAVFVNSRIGTSGKGASVSDLVTAALKASVTP